MIKTFTRAAVAATTMTAVTAMLAFGAAPASAATTTATSSGWINSLGADNSGGGFGTGLHNNFAGFEFGSYRNWFEFTAPTTSLLAAELSIFNSRFNSTIDPHAIFTLHATTDFSFSGLVGSPSFGSVRLATADNGADHYVSITLNSLGIDYLNANLGSTVRFGGSVTSSEDPTCNDCVAIFGSTNGNPAAQLITTNVPEPASWALMIAGFGLVGAAARRHRTVAIT